MFQNYKIIVKKTEKKDVLTLGTKWEVPNPFAFTKEMCAEFQGEFKHFYHKKDDVLYVTDVCVLKGNLREITPEFNVEGSYITIPKDQIPNIIKELQKFL